MWKGETAVTKAQKLDLEIQRCWVDWYPLRQGILLYTAYSPVAPSAAGSVWVQRTNNQRGEQVAIVLDSYVPQWARRQGIRTLINKTIAKHADIIMSPQGSKDGGEAFMKAEGYVLDKATGWWVWRKPKSPRKAFGGRGKA
jgi:hypothetical protein